ncbi:protein WEAK CHLOROPLAST MOVEMENT UNDER BLUE LIGHT 1-like [Phragmites australis]|uniref:protein WEAK CHLOROPLAST MOVEMENT UNDER BLUE LIGHT 1-like n=1 Tax=Phragmites australis TaxID=29695 RepID=UPI002D78831F|nr:protein WEAK CHLOROPLAST MOVEMENT UNDER BLUE LIGHT 1-like [Phragmites australis]XP_062215424.1 protein WEAK CHLOROPLAST MOVEMENT UNDER BLUE LIGHT 1-like [Phragmites australis]XP_062215425.1 protein WEAK CHLOROPLAST MOVEMENT UNDER BLUE LIGHT 1-like [Phragmites australis]
MEVFESNGHGKTRIQNAENLAPVSIESPDTSLEIQQKLQRNLTEHLAELESPIGHAVISSPKIPSHFGPAQAFDDSSKDEADHAILTNKTELKNISENGFTSVSTMITAEMKSKEEHMNDHENIVVTPERKEESEKGSEGSYRGFVDTTAPFESVKEAVTKFGGIVDWKAYRAQSLERCRVMQLELEKIQQEIPQFKEDWEAAEVAKSHVIKELERTKRFVEELKHKLDRAQLEVDQAKQDSELAQLRAQEMEQGIDDEASVIAQTQLTVAKERHEKAAEELKLIKEELRSTREQYSVLTTERDTAVKRAEEAVSAAKETEKQVEDVTSELIASKESLESAHAAHHEAEEHRLGAALAKEHDCLAWEKELQQAHEELHQLNEQILSKTDVESKVDENVRKLLSLQGELAAYMENKLSDEAGVVQEQGSKEAKEISRSIKEALASKRKELDEVRGKLEYAENEANLIRVIAETLRTELDKEKASLVTLQQRECMASITVSSLEAELNSTKQEIEMVHKKEAETQEKMVKLPRMLQQAAHEAEDAKMAAHLAQEELRRAKEEAEQTKASATTADVRLRAVLKEIEASNASERLALVAAQAMQESEETRSVADSPRGVTLPISEYHAFSKRVHEAEELANERVAAALAQIELAKDSESRRLDKLHEASKEMSQKKDALQIALVRADMANEGKLGAEKELRRWRAEREQRGKAHEAVTHAVSHVSAPSKKFADHKSSYQEDGEFLTDSKLHMSTNSMDHFVPDQKLRKKKSFFRRMSTILSRKAQTQT